jgi:hypothetical protein
MAATLAAEEHASWCVCNTLCSLLQLQLPLHGWTDLGSLLRDVHDDMVHSATCSACNHSLHHRFCCYCCCCFTDKTLNPLAVTPHLYMVHCSTMFIAYKV